MPGELFFWTKWKKDMLQVEYPNQLLLDMGWYQNVYMICIIRDFDWEHPVIQYAAADKKRLRYD